MSFSWKTSPKYCAANVIIIHLIASFINTHKSQNIFCTESHHFLIFIISMCVCVCVC